MSTYKNDLYYKSKTEFKNRIKPELNKICSYEDCPYHTSFLECLSESIKSCNSKDCPFKKQDKNSEIDFLKAISNNKRCMNETCTPKILCKICNIKMFANETETCFNTQCPFEKVEEEESCKALPICNKSTCPYMLIYKQILEAERETEYNYYTKSVQCVVNPKTKIESSEETSVLMQATCSVDTCPYKNENVECKLDESTNEQKYKAEDYVYNSSLGQDILISTPPMQLEIRQDIYSAVNMEIPCRDKTCKFKKRKKFEILSFKDIRPFTEEFIDDIIADATDVVTKLLHKTGVQKENKSINDIQVSGSSTIKLTADKDKTEGQKDDKSKHDIQVISSTIKLTVDKDWGPEKNFIWPSIKDFSIPLGAQKITEYIALCDVKEQWLCGIYYIKMTKDSISSYYHYEVICGLPTNIYPIAQATASIYFKIEVSKVIPKCCPIHVTFQLETNRYIFDAAETMLNEKWLLNILHSKIGIFRSIDY